MKKVPLHTNAFTRRRLLGSLAGGALLGASSIGAPVLARSFLPRGTPSITPSATALNIVLTFTADGKTLSFSQGLATDIGDYVGTFVQQKCYRQRASGNNDYRDGFMVMFRPDTNGLRNEIVVEFGTEYVMGGHPPLTARSVTPVHVGAYTAVISGGGLVTPVTISVPAHPWAQRWRWQSSLRPIIRTANDLVVMKAIMPLDNTQLYSASPPTPVTWGGPMSLGGMNNGMGVAGDHPWIGLWNDFIAYWMLTGNDDTSWRAIAEATGTMPFWIRDIATGALFSVKTYPYICFNDANHGTHAIPKPASAGVNTHSFVLEADHMPAASMHAFLLTDDPYFLEGAQGCANYHILESNLYTINRSLPGLVPYAGTRGFTWGLRDQTMQVGFCPTTLPGWFLSNTYWQSCLADGLTYVTLCTNNTAGAATSVFGIFPQTTETEAFANGYAALWAGWAKWSGLFPTWDIALEYASRFTRKIADPTSGWDRRMLAPYLVPVQFGRTGVITPLTYCHSVGFSADTPTTWAELWSDFQPFAASHPNYMPNWTDPSTWPPDTLNPQQSAYLPEIRAANAALAHAGYTDSIANYPWIEAHLRSDFAPGTQPKGNYKWAVQAPP